MARASLSERRDSNSHENQQMLDLNELGGGLPGVTPELGSAFAQAAAVCLELQGHDQGTHLRIDGQIAGSYPLAWPPAGDQARRAWADHQEATEFGAIAIAMMLIKDATDYTVIERAVKGTGIDYWLGYDEDAPPFQNRARLEVSGILSAEGTADDVVRAIDRRVREKLRQTQPSSGSLPVFVVVIEFGSPRGKVQKS